MSTIVNNHAPYATVLLMANNSISWSLEYHLQAYISSSGNELYGIKVNKLDSDGNVVDAAETYSITESHDKALAIITYLANGLVKPPDLLTMVDDWFSDEVWSADRTSSMPATWQTSRTEV